MCSVKSTGNKPMATMILKMTCFIRVPFMLIILLQKVSRILLFPERLCLRYTCLRSVALHRAQGKVQPLTIFSLLLLVFSGVDLHRDAIIELYTFSS